MGRLIGRRLLFLLPVLFGILVVVFVTMRIVPGDPARLVAGPDAGPQALEAIRHEFGLDQPLHVQFERYLLDVLRGEFGRSLKTQRPVLDEIGPRLWNTALLAVLSTLFAATVGLLAGIVAAARRHSAFDHVTMVVAMMGVSTPSFYLGIVLIVVFAVLLGLFPAGGSGGLVHLVLPAVTLGASTFGIGGLIVESIGMRDFPVVQGSILLVTFVSVLVNLVADLLYGYADPRVKY